METLRYTSQGCIQNTAWDSFESEVRRGTLHLQSSVYPPLNPGVSDEEYGRNAKLLLKNVLEAATCDASVLEAMEKAIDMEGAEKLLEDALKAWAEAAGELTLLRMAKDVRMAAMKPASIRTVWTDIPSNSPREYSRKTISNNCFAATVLLTGERKYDGNIRDYVWANIWHARWELVPNYRNSCGVIQSIERRFTDLEEAKKYLQGRMNYLSKKYFYDADPVIPLGMREYFLVHGLEIPGMNYEKG